MSSPWPPGTVAASVFVDHGVERVADHDHERVWAVLLGVIGDVLDDREIRTHDVVARLARLARDTSGDNQHVDTSEVLPVGTAGDLGVAAGEHAGLLEIERFALR